jgi:hypothetical protein
LGRGFKVNKEKLKKLVEELRGTLEFLEIGAIAQCLDDRSIIKNLIKHQIRIIDAITEDMGATKEDKMARIKTLVRYLYRHIDAYEAMKDSGFKYNNSDNINEIKKELDELLEDRI